MAGTKELSMDVIGGDTPGGEGFQDRRHAAAEGFGIDDVDGRGHGGVSFPKVKG
jgi:hypothetical protein